MKFIVNRDEIKKVEQDIRKAKKDEKTIKKRQSKIKVKFVPEVSNQETISFTSKSWAAPFEKIYVD